MGRNIYKNRRYRVIMAINDMYIYLFFDFVIGYLVLIYICVRV